MLEERVEPQPRCIVDTHLDKLKPGEIGWKYLTTTGFPMINLALPASGWAGLTTQMVLLTVFWHHSSHSQLGSRHRKVQENKNKERKLG